MCWEVSVGITPPLRQPVVGGATAAAQPMGQEGRSLYARSEGEHFGGRLREGQRKRAEGRVRWRYGDNGSGIRLLFSAKGQ